MHPSRLLLIALAISTLLSLVLVFDPELLTPLLALDGLIALVALVDFVSTRRIQLVIHRHCRDVFSLGEPNRVTVEVTSRSNRSLELAVQDDLFEGCESRGLPGAVSLSPRGSASFQYQVIPSRRGAFRLGDHFVRFPSILRLWTVQLRLRDDTPIRVYPDLALIRTFELLARTNREYALVRATRLRGGESEFARLRDYTSDDDYRAIDWKATARRQRLTAREYQLESDQNVFFMIDAGRLMTARVGELSQFDHALNATLMLAHVATRGGDKVGLLSFDEEVRAFVPPEGGRHASRTLIRAAYDLHPRIVESDFDRAFEVVGLRLRRRSLLVVFTQLIDDQSARNLARHMRAQTRRHLPLIVMLDDNDLVAMANGSDVSDEDALVRENLYRRGAAAELLRWKGNAVQELERQGALVLRAPAASLTGSLINRYLEVKARQLL